MIEENKLKEMQQKTKLEEAIREKPGFRNKKYRFQLTRSPKARRDWGLSDDIGLGR